MDHPRPPAANPVFPMPQPARHQLLVCRDCRHTGRPCLPGLALLERLRAAIAAARPDEAFEISGSASLADCPQPCTVAWRVTAGGAWLFGDVDPDGDIEELMDFVGSGGPPGGDGPAAVIVTREGAIQ
jgi:predicted metal-binding protein